MVQRLFSPVGTFVSHKTSREHFSCIKIDAYIYFSDDVDTLSLMPYCVDDPDGYTCFNMSALSGSASVAATDREVFTPTSQQSHIIEGEFTSETDIRDREHITPFTIKPNDGDICVRIEATNRFLVLEDSFADEATGNESNGSGDEPVPWIELDATVIDEMNLTSGLSTRYLLVDILSTGFDAAPASAMSGCGCFPSSILFSPRREANNSTLLSRFRGGFAPVRITSSLSPLHN